ncbi:D-lactate dehydrogenase [Luteimonas sp. RIT-PG2_3]
MSAHDTLDAGTLDAGARGRLLERLRTVVGEAHVLSAARAMRRYTTGFRFGGGEAVAVVRPGTLYEQWQVLQACVDADAIVIVQASNTGLTGGSTPAATGYDRDVVVISTTRLDALFVIEDGRQVVCLPGATLHRLEKTLKPLGREPHSVIGSSCFGASVVGGVCNNSGGALTRRGAAYTQMALFARVDAQGRLALVNHLGIALGEEPEEILRRLQDGDFDAGDIGHPARAGSDGDYEAHVRDVEADTPARYNADPRRLFEASGSAGKLMVFAVRLDTFALEQDSRVFYIGSNDVAELTALRRLLLTQASALPIAGEYLHRDAFDLADRYGKDQFVLIERLGTDRLPAFFALKSRCDDLCARQPWLPRNALDRLLHALGRWWPDHLPARLRQYRDRYEHHLILRVAGDAVEDTQRLLSAWKADGGADFFECTDIEARKAFLHRFVIAGAAVRYRAIHPEEVEDIVALDIALRRNDEHWFESLPPALARQLLHRIYYGHFLCHVFHNDYLVRKGEDCLAVEHAMWRLLDARGARYPAEHNVGHLYVAEPALMDFYRGLDPGNRFNAGIGQSSKHRGYAGDGGDHVGDGAYGPGCCGPAPTTASGDSRGA